jgi:hypothetical protein
MADRTSWTLEGIWVEACNCDYGCPCNYNGFPTKGACQGMVGVKITKGTHGGTKLDGLHVVGAVMWPGAIHEGNGKGAIFIDEEADEKQRAALTRIVTGQDGGMPWEVLATTLSEVKGPFYAPITFEDKGTKTKVSTKGVEAELTPFKNPITGEDHEVHTVVPSGFIWTDANMAMSARNVVKVDGIEFDHTGQNAYYAAFSWSNAELHEGAPHTRFEH